MAKRKYNSSLQILKFFLLFSLNIYFSFGSNTLFADQSLSREQTLVSSDGSFELGFYRSGNSSNYYLGIWYADSHSETIVWVANRDKPIFNLLSAQLKISNGNLLLLSDYSQTPIWSTNINSTLNSVVVVLRDTGNLVLTDGSNSKFSDSNLTTPIWQSFDYPTNTWLPGAKMRYNKRTKTSQVLTSWKNWQDPGEGPFSLKLDITGTGLYLWYRLWLNMSKQYWSGQLDGQSDGYNLSYTDNEDEAYFTYSVHDSSVRLRFVLDVSGQFQMLTSRMRQWELVWFEPRQKCQILGCCGAFVTRNMNSLPRCSCLTGFQPRQGDVSNLDDYLGGCTRRTYLQCGNNGRAKGDEDGFVKITHIGLPDDPQHVPIWSEAECESFCLNNCSCTAYAFEGRCSIWNGELSDLEQLSDDDFSGAMIHIKLASSEFSSARKNNKGVIGVVLGSVAVALVLVGLVLVVIISKMRKRFIGTKNALEGSLVLFRYKDLRNATNHFSKRLGGGSFGSVFKGTLYDSTMIAVKRLEGINQGEKQFRAEVSTIGTIQHVNLVRLRGFCSDANKKLLVYEYMPNGSLHSHLFHAKDSKVLDWKKRYQIALGIARGLAYLHEECRDCIIHCDIKPENILLDAEFCPKVADFGLAKLFGREFSRVLTTMRGTRGYLAPEWISGVAITSKADVYSYGMMLFELVSGRRNTQLPLNNEIIFFPTQAASVTTTEGNLISLLDNMLDNIADVEEVTRICRIACWCVQDEENLRPSMGQVVQILEGVLDVKLPQMPPSLQLLADNKEEHTLFFTEFSSGLSSQARVHPLSISH